MCCGLYAGLTTLIYRSFVVTAFDASVIEQVVGRLARFSTPITEVEGHGVNYFGDHFSPVLALYAPFYRLVPVPETLFVIQGAVLAMSVVVIMRTATCCLGRRTGLLVTVLYALSFGVLNSVVMSARETPFAVLFLALAGAAFLRGSARGVVLASLGLLLVKEDLGLTVAAIGFVLALRAHTRRAGVALMVIGTAAFIVVMWVVIPSLSSTGASPYASSPGTMLHSMVDGWRIKLFTVIITFGVAGILAVRNRWALVVVPTLAWRFTAPNPAYWTPLFHYSAVLMPVVFIAGIAVLRDSTRTERRMALVFAGLATATTLSWMTAVQILPVVDVYSSGRPEAAERALTAVPAGATVVSDEYLIGHLVGDRTTYYMVEFEGCPRPDYVVAHVGIPQRHIWGGRVSSTTFVDVAAVKDFADTTYGAGHEVITDEEGYVVLRRRSESASTEPCVPGKPDASMRR